MGCNLREAQGDAYSQFDPSFKSNGLCTADTPNPGHEIHCCKEPLLAMSIDGLAAVTECLLHLVSIVVLSIWNSCMKKTGVILIYSACLLPALCLIHNTLSG